MSNTVIAVYGDQQTASAVVSDLTNAGFKRSDITVMANKSGSTSGSGLGSVTDASSGTVTKLGAPQEQARLYVESVNQGNILVAAKTSDGETPQAQQIMQRHGMIDLERSRRQGRSQQQMTGGSTSGTS